MPDNPTLSERLRAVVHNVNEGAMPEAHLSAWLRLCAPEILQALDDNDGLRRIIAAADICGEIGFPCPWCSARSYDCNVEAMHASTCPWLRLQTTGQLEADSNRDYLAKTLEITEAHNERYRATIVQLEKERKEAVDRVFELEKYQPDTE